MRYLDKRNDRGFCEYLWEFDCGWRFWLCESLHRGWAITALWRSWR
jgi:hypothetical protein